MENSATALVKRWKFCLNLTDLSGRLYVYIYKASCLMELGVQCRIHKGSPVIPILSRLNLIPNIATYIFKIHSILIVSSHLRLDLPTGLFPVGLPIGILKPVFFSFIMTI